MSYIVLELNKTPGWTMKNWNGESVCTHDTNVRISKLCRVWEGPDGRTYMEDSAYNVAKEISKAENYIPVQPVQLGPSEWIVNLLS